MENVDIVEWVKSCGTPLIMFIFGLFFPQVKLRQILQVFSLGHSHDDKKE